MSDRDDIPYLQYQNYRYCYENGHDDFMVKGRECFEFWDGNQWDPQVKATLLREGRPALTFNVIESLVRSMKGLQRALRNDVRFAPAQEADSQSAQIKDAIWLDVQNQNALDFLETDLYEKGLIMSRSYLDVRMDYTESVQGDIKVRPRRSQDVILDPSVEEYDPDTWPQIITRRWVSYHDIQQRFGKHAAKEIGLTPVPAWYDYEDRFMAQQMGHLPYYNHVRGGEMDMKNARGHLLLERQYTDIARRECFVDVETGDWSQIPENWDDNKISRVLQTVSGISTTKRDVKVIHWSVVCENVVLHHTESPYKHFTIVPYFPSFIDGVMKGAVESLIDPQQLYNKITSSELHIISTTANSGYKVKSGSLKNMTTQELEQTGAKSGFVAVLEDVSHLEKIQPNQVPQGHDRLSFKADQIMRSLSGVSNQARGFAREDVAGDAIEANQAAQDINFAGWLSNLHRTKQLLARNVIDCAQQHYTDTRTILINRGSAMSPNVQSVTINQPTPEGTMLNDITRGKYTTVLIPAPCRTSLSEEEFRMLLELRKDIGIQIPDSMLIELSPAINKSAILQAISGKPDSNAQQQQANQAAQAEQQSNAQKVSAQAARDQSAAQLNQARARKALMESQTPPDAAYERIENARIATEERLATAKHALESERVSNDAQYRDDEMHFKYTQLAHQAHEGRANRAAGVASDLLGQAHDAVKTEATHRHTRLERRHTSTHDLVQQHMDHRHEAAQDMRDKAHETQQSDQDRQYDREQSAQDRQQDRTERGLDREQAAKQHTEDKTHEHRENAEDRKVKAAQAKKPASTPGKRAGGK